MGSIVLLHFEDALTSEGVQGEDPESVWLGEAWTLACDLVRSWNDLCFAFVENDMRFVGILIANCSQLEEKIAGWSPCSVMTRVSM